MKITHLQGISTPVIYDIVKIKTALQSIVFTH